MRYCDHAFFSRRPSLIFYILPLFCKPWTEFNETLQEASTKNLLPSLCFRADLPWHLIFNHCTGFEENRQKATTQRLPSFVFRVDRKTKKNDHPVNKGPQGPHIDHLSTMCHLPRRISKAGYLCFSNLGFSIGPKHINLVKDINLKILLPFKFHQTPFSSSRGISQSEAGVAILVFFFLSVRKTQTWRWVLASCKVSANSVQRFQRRSRKCLIQSEARAVILFFLSDRKIQT